MNVATDCSGSEHCQWFVNGIISYASLDYDLERNSLVDSESRITGDTDGSLFSVGSTTGYQYQIDKITVTPTAGIRYTTLGLDSYTETGGLGLDVDDDVDTLITELGATASATYDLDKGWQVSPNIRLAWEHEYLGEEEEVTARIGGQTFTQEGFEREQDTINVGVGIELSNSDKLSISLDYDGRIGSDFESHSGSLNLRYSF